jgi:hypothetical protein
LGRGDRLLADALAGGADVSPPSARLAGAEVLARSGRLGNAGRKVRLAALESMRSSDQPRARHVEHKVGAVFVANVVDLGRAPIVGLVEPGWGLRRITDERSVLDQLMAVS